MPTRHLTAFAKKYIQEYVSKLNLGISGGLTVDGPKGPRQQCKPGAAIIASQTGAPILPVVGIANRYWEFDSWDKFKIPKPFAKIVMLYGCPIQVESDASQERILEICNQVTQVLQNLEHQLRN